MIFCYNNKEENKLFLRDGLQCRRTLFGIRRTTFTYVKVNYSVDLLYFWLIHFVFKKPGTGENKVAYKLRVILNFKRKSREINWQFIKKLRKNVILRDRTTSNFFYRLCCPVNLCNTSFMFTWPILQKHIALDIFALNQLSHNVFL